MRRALFCVLLFTLVPAGIAVAEEGFVKVTGGGQVVADEQMRGPGDTIAFNAQQTDEANMDMVATAKGQLQVIDRLNGVKFHGVVTCIRSMPSDDGFTRFGGFQRARDGSGVPFTVDVMDNGEGSQADDDDMIAFRRRAANEDNPCDDSDVSTELRDTRLARGNVQHHSAE